MSLAAIIALLTFVLVTSALLWLYQWTEKRLRRAWVLKRLGEGADTAANAKQSLYALWQHVVRRSGDMAMPKKGELLSEIRTQLAWAGYRADYAVTSYFGIRVCLALALAMVYLLTVAGGGHYTPKDAVFIFFPLALGYYLPGLVLKQMVARRQQAIFKELPDALDLLLICIEAGLSFDMALHRISRELADVTPVLSFEFGQYFLEIQSGLPRKQVLRSLSERNGSTALSGVVNVLLQSIRFGTDVAEALRVHIQSMRTERRQNAEEKGATISTQLTFPLIMLIMPALLIVILGPAMINIMERLKGGL